LSEQPELTEPIFNYIPAAFFFGAVDKFCLVRECAPEQINFPESCAVEAP